MAKANTFSVEKGGYVFEKHCKLCDNTPEHRCFYYPTYFNGDAEWLGDVCEEHKNVEMNDLTTNTKTV